MQTIEMVFFMAGTLPPVSYIYYDRLFAKWFNPEGEEGGAGSETDWEAVEYTLSEKSDQGGTYGLFCIYRIHHLSDSNGSDFQKSGIFRAAAGALLHSGCEFSGLHLVRPDGVADPERAASAQGA